MAQGELTRLAAERPRQVVEMGAVEFHFQAGSFGRGVCTILRGPVAIGRGAVSCG
jgi:hypothetical protein